MSSLNYQLLLCEELAIRKRRNPAYSLTAFSKSLGISAASLSQIISGKRPMSRKSAKKIIDRCLFSAEKRQAFLESAFAESVSGIGGSDFSGGYQEIDSFRMISDWYHFAILGLADLKSNRAEPRWIAQQLSISLSEARDGFERLLRLGLVAKYGRRGFRAVAQTSVPTSAAHETAIRKYHHQNLRKAEEALDGEKVALELFSSITMAANEENLEEARKLIRDFRRKLSRVLEQGDRKRVYTLSMQLFPVSQKVGGKHEKNTLEH